MVLEKAFHCLSLRLGTLMFLYFFMIYILWALFRLTIILFGDRLIETLWNENAFLLTGMILFWVVEFLIFSAAIISISNQTPSKFLIWGTVPFFIFQAYVLIFGNLEMAYLLITQEDVHYSLQNKIEFVASVIISPLLIYALFVLYGYITELKKQSGCQSNSEKIEKEIKHRLPTFHNEKHATMSPLYPEIHSQYPK